MKSRILVVLLALGVADALASEPRIFKRPTNLDRAPQRTWLAAQPSDPDQSNPRNGTTDPDELMAITRPVSLEELTIRERVAPRFPVEERKVKASDCVMRLFIDERGFPLRAVPMDCDARFVDASEDALMQWRFDPYRKDGEAQPVRTDVLVEYRR